MTDSEYLILGLLFNEPNHAYHLDQILTEKGFKTKVNLAFSSIYATLKKLEKKGYLSSKIVKTEKMPDRKIYSLTSSGKDAFLQLLKKYLTYPKAEKSSFELSLHFSNFVSKDELKEILKMYEAELNRQIQNQVNKITSLSTHDPLERALYDRALRLWQAEKQWLKELLIMI
jgi:DNA-binding PadR family transcriptional regulator